MHNLIQYSLRVIRSPELRGRFHILLKPVKVEIFLFCVYTNCMPLPYITVSGPIGTYVTLGSLGWLLRVYFPNLLSALQCKLRPNYSGWWSLDGEHVALLRKI